MHVSRLFDICILDKRAKEDMKIGYPCINTSIVRKAPSTFRLASYNEDCLVKVVRNNLDHLEKILHYNVKKQPLVFSNLFRPHTICISSCM